MQYQHLFRGIPNNFFTRWLVRLLNKQMKRSESGFRLKKRYRKPKKGQKYTWGGSLQCRQAKKFSIYLEETDRHRWKNTPTYQAEEIIHS